MKKNPLAKGKKFFCLFLAFSFTLTTAAFPVYGAVSNSETSRGEKVAKVYTPVKVFVPSPLPPKPVAGTPYQPAKANLPLGTRPTFVSSKVTERLSKQKATRATVPPQAITLPKTSKPPVTVPPVTTIQNMPQIVPDSPLKTVSQPQPLAQTKQATAPASTPSGSKSKVQSPSPSPSESPD